MKNLASKAELAAATPELEATVTPLLRSVGSIIKGCAAIVDNVNSFLAACKGVDAATAEYLHGYVLRQSLVGTLLQSAVLITHSYIQPTCAERVHLFEVHFYASPRSHFHCVC